MDQNPKKLDLVRPLLFLGIFLLIVVILFVFMAFLSKQRKEGVYLAYANETQKYIQQNRASLLVLFNDIFPKSYCVGQPEPQPVPATPCAYPNQETIAKLLPGTLKDWSSTAFLKKDQGKMFLMRLSGDTREFFPDTGKAIVLDKLFSGEVGQIPWDDYTYELAGKEVVVAIKDDSGRVVGAIVRGVIEEKSF